MSRRKRHQPDNPLLAQMLLHVLQGTSTPCEAQQHQQRSVPATWEVRCYQDMSRLISLIQQGVDREQATQLLWDETCQEQDTIGIQVHSILHLCDTCAQAIVEHHGGQEAAFLSMTTAMVTGGSLLLVSDRLTENAAIVSNISRDIQEQDLLTRLQNETMLDLRFKA